jgi:hypothetical protein
MSADQWGALSVVVERAFDTPTEVCAGISRMRYLPYGASISGGGRRGHQDLHAGGDWRPLARPRLHPSVERRPTVGEYPPTLKKEQICGKMEPAMGLEPATC